MGTFAPATWLASVLLVATGQVEISDGDGNPSVSAEDAARAAQLLAAKPRIVERTRLPEIKLLEIVGRDAVFLRTDQVIVQRMKGEGLYDDHHSPADSIKLLIGGRCRLGGGQQWEDLRLLKIEGKTAVFHRDAHPRRGKPVEEVVAVTPYRDARWLPDPTDPTVVTYIEFDAQGRKRLKKNYTKNQLDGDYTSWYSNGRPEARYHYLHGWRDGTWIEWHPNGRKRHEVYYRNDVAVGREEWWDAEGRPTAIGEHPENAAPTEGAKARK